MLRCCINLLAALLLVGMFLSSVTPSHAQAPGAASLRIVVRDATATPQPGITILLDTGDGMGVTSVATDAAGETPLMTSPTSMITITRVFDQDGIDLAFPMTTLDGLLMLPLTGEQTVYWSYDAGSRSVIDLPRTMASEAFPERPAIDGEADTVEADAGDRVPGTTAEMLPVLLAETPPESGAGSRIFGWVLVGLLLMGVGMGVLVWMGARRQSASGQKGRRP